MKLLPVISAVILLAVFSGCASTTRSYAIRLKPGEDLRGAIEQFVRARGLKAAFVQSCAGSVRSVSIRFANQPRETVTEGPLEIVSLSGTISPDGAHLHIAVSDATGHTIGGHLASGSPVFTTAEIVIGELRGVRFTRETDPATTYKELVIH